MRNGWYSASVPVARPISGTSTTAPKIVIMKIPPVLCTHLPTDKPSVEVTTINDSSPTEASVTNQPLLVIHAALGPIA